MIPPKKNLLKKADSGTKSSGRRTIVFKNKKKNTLSGDTPTESYDSAELNSENGNNSLSESKGLLLKKPQEDVSESKGLLLRKSQENVSESKGLLLKKSQENPARQSQGLLKKTQENPARQSQGLLKKTQGNPLRQSQGLLVKEPQANPARQSQGLLVKEPQANPARQSQGLLKKTQGAISQSSGLTIKKTQEVESEQPQSQTQKSGRNTTSRKIKLSKGRKSLTKSSVNNPRVAEPKPGDTAWDNSYVPTLKKAESQKARIQKARESLSLPSGMSQFLKEEQEEKVAPVTERATPTLEEFEDSRGYLFGIVKPGIYPIGTEGEAVEIKASYAIAKYAITKAEFLEFIADTNHDFTEEELKELHEISPSDFHPAINISWNDAIEFCRWLTKKTNEYYTLPSSDEWEAAARGTEGRLYPWGDTPEPNPSFVCFAEDHIHETTCEVTQYEFNTSPIGAVSMVGNVLEWTRDSFDDDRDPHIIRGGSWQSPAEYCTNTSFLMSYPPTKRTNYIGLRLMYLPGEMKEEYLKALNS